MTWDGNVRRWSLGWGLWVIVNPMLDSWRMGFWFSISSLRGLLSFGVVGRVVNKRSIQYLMTLQPGICSFSHKASSQNKRGPVRSTHHGFQSVTVLQCATVLQAYSQAISLVSLTPDVPAFLYQ